MFKALRCVSLRHILRLDTLKLGKRNRLIPDATLSIAKIFSCATARDRRTPAVMLPDSPAARCSESSVSLRKELARIQMPRAARANSSFAGPEDVTRKRGGSEAQRKLHDYLVSKSVRGNKALEGLQEVRHDLCFYIQRHVRPDLAARALYV